MPKTKYYETPEQMQAMIEDYIEQMEIKKRPLTWTGLAYHLGFTTRYALDTYAKYEGFKGTIERAKLLVEMSYEERLHGNACTGAIFALKNFGWTDRQELVGRDGADLFGAFSQALQDVDSELDDGYDR